MWVRFLFKVCFAFPDLVKAGELKREIVGFRKAYPFFNQGVRAFFDRILPSLWVLI